ncbi:MAG TPA: hypothetical protein VJN69_04615 [Candidatus Acidoferrales bacterium]|nr:hypothetical protein [Candidatus Acidoferrales bacterium]
MFDIVEAIHRALRIESTWAFVLVIALGAAAVGGFLAWVADASYKNSPEYAHSRSSSSVDGPARPDPPPYQSAPTLSTRPTHAPSHSGQIKPNGQVNTGDITQMCGAIVLGGENNSASVSCGPQMPPRRIISPAKQTSLSDALKENAGSVQIVSFSNDDSEDVLNLAAQLNKTFQDAGWRIVPTFDGGEANNVVVATANGPKRLGGKSLVCAPAATATSEITQSVVSAFKAAGIPCIVDSDFALPMGYGPMAWRSGVHPDMMILISKRIPR